MRKAAKAEAVEKRPGRKFDASPEAKTARINARIAKRAERGASWGMLTSLAIAQAYQDRTGAMPTSKTVLDLRGTTTSNENQRRKGLVAGGFMEALPLRGHYRIVRRIDPASLPFKHRRALTEAMARMDEMLPNAAKSTRTFGERIAALTPSEGVDKHAKRALRAARRALRPFAAYGERKVATAAPDSGTPILLRQDGVHNAAFRAAVEALKLIDATMADVEDAGEEEAVSDTRDAESDSDLMRYMPR